MPASGCGSSSWGVLASVLVFLVVLRGGEAQLCPNYYDSTCPQFSSIVESVVTAAVARDPRMGASLLRLLFHDCFVQGCDASVLLDDTVNFTGEKTAFPNVNSLRGFEVIDAIKSQVESACPGVVSCADIVAVAARDGVVAVNGPSWTVALGRRDSLTANLSQANSDLPAPFLNLSGLVSAFAKKGFTASEMVTLSGGHTIGQARCVTFRARIYNETTIDRNYAAALRASCPPSPGNGDSNLSPLDGTTPTNFDGAYYQNLLQQRGLLHSDQQLLSSISTALQVALYSVHKESFYGDFAAAMVKMSNLGVLTGSQGQIRSNCRRVNPSSDGIQQVVMPSHSGPHSD